MKTKKLAPIIITVLIVFALIASDTIFNIGALKYVGSLTAPVGIVVSTTGSKFAGFFGGLGNIGNLQKDNNNLRDKLDAALAEVSVLSQAKKENDSLRADLGFKQTSLLDLVTATVVSYDPSLKNGINVAVTNSTGINKGDPVIAQGFMIGRVVEINGNVIKVLLITDSSSAIPATILNKDITGIAKGKIGNGLIMEQVPQNDGVAQDDTVVTSGLGGDLPKGLILAKVSQIQKVSGSIFQQIELRPMVDFSKLERVMIAR